MYFQGVTADSGDINKLTGVSPGVVVNNKAAIYGDAGQLNATSIQIEGSTVTSSAAELNLVDGSESGTVVNNRAVIYGSSGEINAKSLQLDDVAVLSSAAELNILKGVTSNNEEINLLDGANSSNDLGERAIISTSNLDLSGLRNIDISGNLTTSGNVVIGSTTLRDSDAAHINDISSGTAAAEKAVVLDSSKNISGINNIILEGTLSDGTMNLVGGVLSNLASASIESNNALLTVKSTDPSDGASKIRMVSDNSGEKGDGIEIKSVNGVTTFSTDHNEIGSYGETIMTMIGNDNADDRQVLITGTLQADKLSVQDNDTINIGTGNDMKLYHDGSDSYISNETGNLNDRYLE